ncbi:F-box/LRR-repeat protein At3g58900-like [Cannabis sativa]|uniref:F-box/LRR-repeat protein At3g58900-like n=1 Tax=Cannabis sativa TaxID=3483 RepID=UPI0029CA0F8A|nr:F-box/LRR-repeat protein At3g58900-like [Cannabis sativa]
MVGNDDDRISKLPDTLIHHILSFLPTQEVVRTCLLSKRWKLIWYLVPTIFFPYSTITYCSEVERKQVIEKFYIYLEKYLEHRKKGMYFIDNSVVLTSFKLEMLVYYKKSKAGVVDKWLAFAVENKVKEINLTIGEDRDNGGYYYCLPKILDNARYLTILQLYGVELDTSHSFNFPLLKTLSLIRVQSDTGEDDVVFKFLLCSPSLEKLRLCYYEFLRIGDKSLLQSLSLKFLELTDFSSCKKIRNLSFDDTSDDLRLSLNALISNNPLLENLTLCTDGKIRIESAPELEYFYYGGHMDLSISIDISNSLSGKVVICERGYNNGYDGSCNPERISDLKNSLLWISPSLETLSINKMQIL